MNYSLFAGCPTEDVNVSDILLWALFANRKELAEICWLKGHDHLSKYINTFTTYRAKLIRMYVKKNP